MPSFNQCTFAGNLTRDPEIRYVDGGQKAVAKFAIAINRKVKGKDEAMFLDVVAWDKLADICNSYLKKGMPVLVSGRLDIRQYTNKDGENRRATELVASTMQMLGTKEGGAASSGGAMQDQSYSRETQAHDDTMFGGGRDPLDDEIPFLHDPKEFERYSSRL